MFFRNLQLPFIVSSLALLLACDGTEEPLPECAAGPAVSRDGPCAPLDEEEQATLEWLMGPGSVTIASLEPSAPTEDIEPIVQRLAPARLIGLGEGGHFIREYHLLRHRLVRELASRHGFTELLLEIDHGQAAEIDAFVQGRRDEAALDASLQGRITGIVAATEFRELMLWLRHAQQTGLTQVHVRGVDCQDPHQSTRHLIGFLRAVDMAVANRFEDDLTRFGEPILSLPGFDPTTGEGRILTPEELEAELAKRRDALAEVKRIAAQLLAQLDEQSETYIARSSPDAFASARLAVRTWVQSYELWVNYKAVEPSKRKGSPYPFEFADPSLRDQFMAENTRAFLERTPHSKGILWAENGHVDKSPVDPLGDILGHLLMKSFGDAYQAVGLVPGNVAPPLEPFLAGSMDSMLEAAAAGRSVYAVDLGAAMPPEVASWFAKPRPFRANLYETAGAPVLEPPRHRFDWVIYFDKTSHQTPLGSNAPIPTESW